MISHQITTVILMILLLADNMAFESKAQRIIEVGSELFMHLTTIMLAQFLMGTHSNESMAVMEVCSMVFFGALILLNVVYIVFVFVVDCKEKRRKKAIEKRK